MKLVKMTILPKNVNDHALFNILRLEETEIRGERLEVYCSLEQFGEFVAFHHSNSVPPIKSWDDFFLNKIKNVLIIDNAVKPPQEVHVYNRQKEA